jgi:1-acyl-sn-glycerol-3-phosphate acyltransferase
MDFWYRTLITLVGTYTTLFQASIHVQGKENLPEGPKILIGNHANVTDGFILPHLVKEKLHYFIQQEILTIKGLGPLFKKADQIPVIPGRGREAIDIAIDRLGHGNSIVIFPEGTLNHGRDLQRGRTGAVVLASESGAPLVPLGFYVPDRYMKTFHSNHYNRRTQGRWQFRGPLFLKIGEPRIIPDSYVQQSDYAGLRQASAQLMEYIATLVGQAKVEAEGILGPKLIGNL